MGSPFPQLAYNIPNYAVERLPNETPVHILFCKLQI